MKFYDYVLREQPWKVIGSASPAINIKDYQNAHAIANVCRCIRTETCDLVDSSRTIAFGDANEFLRCTASFKRCQYRPICSIALMYDLEVSVTRPTVGKDFESTAYVSSTPEIHKLPILPNLQQVTVHLAVGIYNLAVSNVTVDALKGHMWFRQTDWVLKEFRSLRPGLTVRAIVEVEDLGEEHLDDD